MNNVSSEIKQHLTLPRDDWMEGWRVYQLIHKTKIKKCLNNKRFFKFNFWFKLRSFIFFSDYFEWNAILQLLWVTRVNWIFAIELFINQWKWFTFSPRIKEMFSCFSGSVSNWLSPFLLLKLFSLNKADENMDWHLIGISMGKISSSRSKEVFFINVWGKWNKSWWMGFSKFHSLFFLLNQKKINDTKDCN